MSLHSFQMPGKHCLSKQTRICTRDDYVNCAKSVRSTAHNVIVQCLWETLPLVANFHLHMRWLRNVIVQCPSNNLRCAFHSYVKFSVNSLAENFSQCEFHSLIPRPVWEHGEQAWYTLTHYFGKSGDSCMLWNALFHCAGMLPLYTHSTGVCIYFQLACAATYIYSYPLSCIPRIHRPDKCTQTWHIRRHFTEV